MPAWSCHKIRIKQGQRSTLSTEKGSQDRWFPAQAREGPDQTLHGGAWSGSGSSHRAQPSRRAEGRQPREMGHTRFLSTHMNSLLLCCRLHLARCLFPTHAVRKEYKHCALKQHVYCLTVPQPSCKPCCTEIQMSATFPPGEFQEGLLSLLFPACTCYSHTLSPGPPLLCLQGMVTQFLPWKTPLLSTITFPETAALCVEEFLWLRWAHLVNTG